MKTQTGRGTPKKQEVIKARAVVTGPNQVGKLILNPKKASCGFTSSSC